MPIKDLIFDIFGIQYYDLRIFSQREQIRRVIVINKGQQSIKVKNVGIFLPPKEFRQIFRRRTATLIFADVNNSELCKMETIDENPSNEKIIDKQYDFKNYYNIIHQTVEPYVMKELFENRGVKDTISQPDDIWTKYGLVIVGAIIIMTIVILFTGM